MAIGPVQLIVLGFDHPEFREEIIATLERLRAADAVQVIDAVAVRKDPAGVVEMRSLSTLDPVEVLALGSEIAALLGVPLLGQEPGTVEGEPGGPRCLRTAAPGGSWDVLSQIPDDSAGALVLVEHHWASELGEAIEQAGGFRIGAGVVDPADLLAAGVLSPEEAAEQQKLLTSREAA